MNNVERNERLKVYVKPIIKGGFYIFFGLASTQIISLFTQVLMARSLGPQDYGLIVLAFSVVTVSVRILSLGVPDGLTRYISGLKDKHAKIDVLKSGIVLSLPVVIVFTFVIFVNSNLLAHSLFKKNQLAPIIKIFSFAIPFSVLLGLVSASLRGYQKAKEKTVTDVVLKGSLLVILVLLYSADLLDIRTATLSWTFSYVIGVAMGSYLLYKTVGISVKEIVRIKRTYSKALMVYSAPLLLSSSLAIIRGQIDIFSIGYFLASDSVGFYNVALKLSIMMSIPLSFLGFIYFPTASKLLKEGKKDYLQDLLPLINKWGTLSVSPLIFLFIVYPGAVLELFFGQEYLVAADALRILTIGYIPFLINGKTGETLKATGHTTIFPVMSLLSFSLQIFLNYLLIPKWGINGAAVSTATIFLIFSSFYMVILKYYTDISPLSRNYVIQLIQLVVVGFITVLINRLFVPEDFNKLIFITFSGLVFAGLFVFLNILTKQFAEEEIMLIEILENATGLSLTKLKFLLKK